MGTTLRAELSEKNPYWIEKHRYYELQVYKSVIELFAMFYVMIFFYQKLKST